MEMFAEHLQIVAEEKRVHPSKGLTGTGHRPSAEKRPKTFAGDRRTRGSGFLRVSETRLPIATLLYGFNRFRPEPVFWRVAAVAAGKFKGGFR